MTTLYCEGCSEFISDEDLVGSVEPHGETLYHCPCGCYELAETLTCVECGVVVNEDNIVSGTDLCGECHEKDMLEAAADAKGDQIRDDRLTGDL